MEVPDWQIQQYNEDLFILRESGCTDPEKPFLYLFFGKDRALLEDTGSGPAETARAVRGVMSRWLKRHQRESIPLVVMHSHSHGDHIAGDGQFLVDIIAAAIASALLGWIVASAFGVRPAAAQP